MADGVNRIALILRRRLRRDRELHRRILRHLATERRAFEAPEIREFGGMSRFEWPEFWRALRQLVTRGLVVYSYEREHWHRAGFCHESLRPVFVHHKWLGLPATPPGAAGPDEGGTDGCR